MNATNHTSTAGPAIVVGDEDEPAYRTLNVLALVSLVFGLLAPLCLIAPLLLAIPLFGAALAIIALRQIAVSEGAMVGRAAALLGLALCVGSVGAWVGRSFTVHRLLSYQAREMGSEFFSRLQSSDVEGAFRMTQASLRSLTPPADGTAPENPSKTAFDDFRAGPVVALLLAHGDHAEVRYDRDIAPGAGTPDRYRLKQQYVVTDQAHGDDPIAVTLVMQRALLDGQTRWIVSSIESDDLPATESATGGHDHAGHPHSH